MGVLCSESGREQLEVQQSGLGEELKPLVQPLIRTLQDSSTT